MLVYVQAVLRSVPCLTIDHSALDERIVTMRTVLSAVLGLCSLVVTALDQPKDLYESSTLSARAEGDSCTVALGTGSCQNTFNCKGIIYGGACPNDSADVKVYTSSGLHGEPLVRCRGLLSI